MTQKSKPTPGRKYRIDHDLGFVSNSEELLACVYPCKHPSGKDDRKEERRANCDLVAEAFLVATETGLTPRQLQEQRDELLAALKDALPLLESFDGTSVENENIIDEVRAVLKAAGLNDENEGV